MKTHVLRILQLEAARQCAFGIFAWQDVVAAVDRLDDDRVWYSVQAMLVAAGNVSKLLWPGRERLCNRGRILRESLQISNDSLLRWRDFRNHFEHFDERIERWAEKMPDGAFVDANISTVPLTAVVSAGESVAWMRNLDTNSWTLSFSGHSYSLSQLHSALCGLHTTAIKEAWKHGKKTI